MAAVARVRQGTPRHLRAHAFLAVLALLVIFPFYWMVVGSTRTTADLLAFPPYVYPGGHLVDNFRKLFATLPVVRAFFNSLFIATVHTALVLFFCSLAGFGFAKYRFPGRDRLFVLMKGVVLDSCEDDLSALIRELLEARLEIVGWSVHGQPKGGFTARENPGERDFVLRKAGAELAVIEAVVCDRPVTQDWTCKELTSHFQKLFGYATCRLFFHLTYAYVPNPATILTYLQQTAERDAPEGFTFLQREAIPLTDSRSPGFAARYAGEFGDVRVVFLVLDLGQRLQRNAAKRARANSPRARRAKQVRISAGYFALPAARERLSTWIP